MASPKAVPTKRSQPQAAENQVAASQVAASQVAKNDVQPSMPTTAAADGSTADSAEKIRESAYYKWEAAGCPCSDGVEFWLQADSEMSSDQRPSKPR